MTEKSRKYKEIHVDKLIVHAKEVEIIHERKERPNPWFFGNRRELEDQVKDFEEENVMEVEDVNANEQHENNDDHKDDERRRPFWF